MTDEDQKSAIGDMVPVLIYSQTREGKIGGFLCAVTVSIFRPLNQIRSVNVGEITLHMTEVESSQFQRIGEPVHTKTMCSDLLMSAVKL